MSDQQEVLYLRLNTGEEIIGKLNEEDTAEENHRIVSLDNPAIVYIQQGPNGDPIMRFAQYMPFAENNNVHIVPTSIQATSKINDIALENYLKVIGDRVIETPNKNIII